MSKKEMDEKIKRLGSKPPSIEKLREELVARRPSGRRRKKYTGRLRHVWSADERKQIVRLPVDLPRELRDAFRIKVYQNNIDKGIEENMSSVIRTLIRGYLLR